MKLGSKEYKRLTIDQINNAGCLNLIEAFVEDIGKEYRAALINYKNNKNIHTREHFNKIRSYISSGFFSALTGLDGQAVLASMDRHYSQKKTITI